MIELILNGVNIDLTGNEDVALSYAASKLQDIKSRNGDFSTTFKVPLTNAVRQAIDFSNIFTSDSSYPYRITEAEIRESGVSVMRGFGRVDRIAGEIEVNVFSGNSNWFDLVGEKTLQDLDLSDLDLTFNAANVEANRLNTYVDGFVFPNVWYGEFLVPANPYSVGDFYPAVYYYRVLKQIFEDIGWTVDGTIFTDPLFLKSAIALSNDGWKRKGNGKVFNYSITDQAYSTGVTGFDYIGFNVKNFDYFSIFNKQPGWTNILANSSYWEVFSAADFKIKGRVSFDVISTLSPMDLAIGIRPAIGTVPTLYHLITTIYPSGPGTSVDYEFDFTLNLPISGADKYVLYFGSAAINSLNNFLGYFELTSEDPYYTDIQPGDQTDIAMALPKDVKQKDWIRTFVNQFNLIITPSPGTKTATFNSFQSIIDNKQNAIDWSVKVDLSQEIELKYLPELYGQENIFRYSDDSNDELISGRDVGKGFFNIDNTNLPSSSLIFESEFSGTKRTDVSGITIAQIPLRLKSVQPRVVHIEITTNNLVTQYGQSAPTQSAEVFFTDLGFDKLIPVYYPGLVIAFNRFKMLRLYMNLKAGDINQIDYMKPIYLDFVDAWIGQVNGYFYLNFVDQYKPGAGETTLVELVKI